MSPAEVSKLLRSEAGRESLTTYAATPANHAALTEVRARSTNTMERAVLAHILTGAALRAMDSGQDLSAALLVSPDEDVPGLSGLPRRAAPVPYTKTFLLDTVAAVVTRQLGEGYVGKALDAFNPYTEIIWSLNQSRYGVVSTLYTLGGAYKRFPFADKTDRERAQRAGWGQFLTTFFTARMLHEDFVTYALDHTDQDWNDFVAHGGAGAGTLARIADKAHISSETWEIVLQRSQDSLRDQLLIAACHPSIVEREQARMAIAAQVAYFLERDDFYDLAEVAVLLPSELVEEIFPPLIQTLRSSWTDEAVREWSLHLSRWGGLELSSFEKKPAEVKRRWWARD